MTRKYNTILFWSTWRRFTAATRQTAYLKHNTRKSLPPASKTRYLEPGRKQEMPPSPLIRSTGRYLQNKEAASGSKARERLSLWIPAWNINETWVHMHASVNLYQSLGRFSRRQIDISLVIFVCLFFCIFFFFFFFFVSFFFFFLKLGFDISCKLSLGKMTFSDFFRSMLNVKRVDWNSQKAYRKL